MQLRYPRNIFSRLTLVQFEGFSAIGVDESACDVEPFESESFQRIEFEEVGSGTTGLTHFRKVGIDLEVSDEIIGHDRDLLVGGVALVTFCGNRGETELALEFRDAVLDSALRPL